MELKVGLDKITELKERWGQVGVERGGGGGDGGMGGLNRRDR